MNSMNKKKLKGFSIIELVIAGAIFIIFSSTFVLFLLQSLSDDRKNAEFSVATIYAVEGLETVEAMSKENFPLLGTVNDGGLEPNETKNWRFHGNTDHFEKYERLMTVEYAKRSGGDISDGGVMDEKTMKITVLVRWESSPGQEEVVTMKRYITYWNEPF